MLTKLYWNLQSMGFLSLTWQQAVMLLVGCAPLFSHRQKYEPLLLLPIAFGVVLTNIPLAGLMDGPWGYTGRAPLLPLPRVQLGIYPPHLHGSRSHDNSPLLANPKPFFWVPPPSLASYHPPGSHSLGFTPAQAGAISIVGGRRARPYLQHDTGPRTLETHSRSRLFLYGPGTHIQPPS